MNENEYKMSQADIFACVFCSVWIIGVLTLAAIFAPGLLKN